MGAATMDAQSDKSQRRSGRSFWILAAIVLVLMLAAFFYGRAAGIKAARAAEAQLAAAREDASRARAEAAALRGQVELLQARRHLHLASLELDRRNFGTTRAHLRAAGEGLAGIANPPSGVDRTELTRLAEELRAVQLAAGENLALYRGRILEWAHRLDRVSPPATVQAELAPDTGAAPPGFRGARAESGLPEAREPAPPPARPRAEDVDIHRPGREGTEPGPAPETPRRGAGAPGMEGHEPGTATPRPGSQTLPPDPGVPKPPGVPSAPGVSGAPGIPRAPGGPAPQGGPTAPAVPPAPPGPR